MSVSGSIVYGNTKIVEGNKREVLEADVRRRFGCQSHLEVLGTDVKVNKGKYVRRIELVAGCP